MKKIFFIVFMITWIGLVVLNFLVPSLQFSEQENRYLASFPEFRWKDLVSGVYAERLNDYINDHFLARNFWLKFHSTIQLVLGKTENNGVYIGKDHSLFEKFQYGQEEKNNLLKVAEAVNCFGEDVTIPICFMLVPNASAIYPEKLPENAQLYDQNKIIEEFYASCQIPTIDVRNLIRENKDKPLYFKTDHHMTSIGAYFLYVSFCHTAGIEPILLSNFERKVVSTNFLGTLDSKAQVWKQEPDEIVVYQNAITQKVEVNNDGEISNTMFEPEYLKKKDQYSYFLDGNHAKTVIKTKVDNGKKLLVIKDSYAHIVAPFFCQNYEEVHLLDSRYYKASISEYINENNITEALFLYNVSNLITDTSLRIIK